MDTGPKIFLRRVSNSGLDLSRVSLLNPSLEEVNNKPRNSNPIIGRLDGTSYYKCSPKNLSNFLSLRSHLSLAKIIGGLPDLNSPTFFDRFFNRYLDRTCIWLLKNSSGLIFQSSLSLEMHKKFLNFNPAQKPHTIINNGVDISAFSPSNTVDKKFGFPSVLMSASTYRLHKRLQEGIKLINFLSQKFPDIKLNVLGDLDSLTSDCVKKLDTSKCQFYGKLDPAKLPFYYKNAHLQLHLSIFDPCPNVVVEGLACGLPVITPLQSGASELIGNANSGWSFDEHLAMEYMELHREEKIPTIDIVSYANIFIQIFENLTYHSNCARHRAETALDIKTRKQEYQSFIDHITGV